MTLRLRLLLGYVMVLAMIVAGAVVVIGIQESYLVELVDRQLQNAMGPVLGRPDAGGPRPVPPQGTIVARADMPVSDLYLAVLVDGEVRPIIVGQLLDDQPALDADTAAAALAAGQPVTVPGVKGVNRFRVRVTHPAGISDPTVVALPMTIVDDAVERLTLTLILGIGLIAAVLGIIVFWVEVLGLRPIRRLTRIADAIAAGERGLRAEGEEERTEAGRLALAFNLMLDERDQGEERLRRFVADASHELRTPLTSIRGYVDLLRDGGEEPEERADMLRRMAGETSRMGDLVEDLLLLARLDEHRPLRRDPVDLRALLEDAALDARVLQPGRPVTVDLPGDAALVIVGDPYRLEQVIGALVHNALTYTEPAAGLVLRAAIAGPDATVEVVDSGPGMDADAAARVFDRFVRGETSRSRSSGGAGLGLSIAQAIVEAHDGTITLETAPGVGCRFTVTLPVNLPADEVSPAAAPA